MRYFYDCEFIEDGRTVDLISIGIVADDGREYYAVAADAPWKRIRKHEWLMDNVVPYLPRGHGDYRLRMPRRWLVDHNDPRVKPRVRIAAEVRDFLLAGDAPELWAHYGAYDHVVLCQLWGPMIDLPAGLPMFTRDVMQEAARLGLVDSLPVQDSGQHNALSDARHVQVMHDWLTSRRTG